MSQEQRVWLAAILSSIVLVVYAQTMSRSSKPAPVSQQLEEQQQITNIVPRETLLQPARQEEVISLESAHLLLKAGKESAAVRSVTLKEHQDIQNGEPLKFENGSPILAVSIGDQERTWDLNEQTDTRASWSSVGQDGLSAGIELELSRTHPTYHVRLTFGNGSGMAKAVPVKLVSTWRRGDKAAGRYNMLEAILLAEKSGAWQRNYLVYRDGVSQTRRVPRGTSLATLSERFFCHSMKLNRTATASLIPAELGTIAASAEFELAVEPGAIASQEFSVYAGPRDFFRLRDAGFEQAFAMGLLTKIGMVLMFGLKAIASVVRSYGLAIILLSVIVTAALSPFTILSFRSMKKMQELQPKMEQLKAKHGADPKRLNKETMQLFREHKVSPLSGCLPMFLQLPIFFALWSAISHVIELRGEPFLWIKDLSLPDRLARLPIGLDLNLLPILMAIAMYVQTKLSQPKVQNPTMSMFSGPLMPLMFGVMFYQVPSGLVLYWLTNSLTSIFWYRMAKI